MHSLIGSSNVYRFYVPKNNAIRVYNMIRCTKLDSFNANMNELGEGCVIISVLENLIVDAAMSDGEDQRKEKCEKLIEEVIEIIKEKARNMPKSKFALVMPIMRPALKWYQDNLDNYKKLVKDNLKKECLGNLTAIDVIPVKSQIFLQDGVHLTKEAGKVFINLMLDSAEDFFEADSVDLADGDEQEEGEDQHEEESEEESEIESKLDKVAKRLDDLEKAFNLRVNSDDLVFARIREEIDSAANKQKEDRIVINGIVSKSPIPRDRKQMIERFKAIATEIFQAIKPGYAFKIVFVNPGKNNGTVIPMVEVKMEKVEQAVELRKAFAVKRKAGELSGNLSKLFISNCVNLATRVRIDILKAISAKITNSKDVAYTFGFTSKPMLHIKPKGSDQRPARSFTFVDAVKNFGKSLVKADLENAYGRAGMAFDGQLQQNFVVLKDSEVDRLSHTGPRSAPRGRGYHMGGKGRGSGSGRGSGTSSGSWSSWSADYATLAGTSGTSGTGSTSGANAHPIGNSGKGQKRKGEEIDKTDSPATKRT